MRDESCRFCHVTEDLGPYNYLGQMVLACLDAIDCMKRMSAQAELISDHRYSEEQNGWPGGRKTDAMRTSG